MDSKQTPKATHPIKNRAGGKTGMLSALATFFGIGEGSPTAHRKGRRVWYKTIVGNRALPGAMQSEVKLCARNKRIRKDEKRRAVHHMQIKLGHFKKG